MRKSCGSRRQVRGDLPGVQPVTLSAPVKAARPRILTPASPVTSPKPGQLTRPVLENHCQVRGHRILILPPRPAPGQSGRHRTRPGLRLRDVSLMRSRPRSFVAERAVPATRAGPAVAGAAPDARTASPARRRRDPCGAGACRPLRPARGHLPGKGGPGPRQPAVDARARVRRLGPRRSPGPAWCTPTWWAPGGPRHGHCRRARRWWPASTTRCPGRPATTRRRPGMRHGGLRCSSLTGRRPAHGRRGSAWTTAGCAKGARRWKACPPSHFRGSPRRG